MKLIARIGADQYETEVVRQGSGYRVRIGERWIEADLVAIGRYLQSLRLEDGTQLALVHHRDGQRYEISFGAATFAIDIIDPLTAKQGRREDEASAGGIIKALMPGRVVRVLVNKGDAVQKGSALLILEAMKMENEIHAPSDGVIEAIFVESGQTVESGTDLIHVS